MARESEEDHGRDEAERPMGVGRCRVSQAVLRIPHFLACCSLLFLSFYF